MGMSTSDLRRACKELNINWPYRQLKSIERLLRTIEGTAGHLDKDTVAVIASLRRKHEGILQNPSRSCVDLSEERTASIRLTRQMKRGKLQRIIHGGGTEFPAPTPVSRRLSMDSRPSSSSTTIQRKSDISQLPSILDLIMPSSKPRPLTISSAPASAYSSTHPSPASSPNSVCDNMEFANISRLPSFLSLTSPTLPIPNNLGTSQSKNQNLP